MRYNLWMRILSIETSCDETAVCLLEAEGTFEHDFQFRILGNALLSQAALHTEYGGVFPNLAKREHAKNLVPLLEEALRQAGELSGSEVPTDPTALLPLKQLLEREEELFKQLLAHSLRYRAPAIDAIAVTTGPGLEPALWVGINFAKALSHLWSAGRRIPIVAVNHMEGHVVMPMMENVTPSSGKMREFDFPLLTLLISGGHTELVLSKTFGAYQLIGETRDDAAGEAFDKVARLLDLPYPGGPEISRLAALAREKGIQGDFTFTRPMMKEDSFDFSFSGLKTAVRNLVEKMKPLTDDMVMKIAREFEDTVADVLIDKTLRAADEYGAKTLIVGGGVSANTRIRELLAQRVHEDGAVEQLLTTSPQLATDNAVMIGLAGYFHALKGQYSAPEDIAAKGNLKLETAV
ncbi:MAG: O-sialoglycoprotein endopeptidase [Parcubacteria group bacterium Athens0416_74]|nr:MAG: O-sialoglycoprotein endopeptidase [Parcubacteria group bacterium Athens0416_74]